MNHHLKFATREMRKNKLIVFGSIVSLVVGIFSVMLIYVWVQNELSTDKMHAKLDRIYMAMIQQSAEDLPGPVDAGLFFNVDYEQYPQVVTKVSTGVFPEEEIKLVHGNEEWRGRGLVADSTFLDVFDFEVSRGDRDALKRAESIILSESMARKMFGDEEAIGQTVHLIASREAYFQVAAIMKDVPSNSSLYFDFVFPMHSMDFWGKASGELLLVSEDFDQEAFEEKMKFVGRKHNQFKESVYSVSPLSEQYFHGTSDSPLFVRGGDINEVYTLVSVALVVLLVSVFNFTNLQTTLIFSQVKNRNIKQVHGATRLDFWKEILSNRLVYAVLGILVVAFLFALIKPFYLDFLGLSENFSNGMMLGYVVLITIGFLLLSLILAVIQTSQTMYRRSLSNQLVKSANNRSGKTLTTIQYVLATVLIIMTAVVFKQFSYMQNKNLGYSPENVVSIRFFEELPYDPEDIAGWRAAGIQQAKDHERLRGELGQVPGVISHSQGSLPIDVNVYNMSWKPANSDFEYSQVNFTALQPGYDEVFGLKVIQGRFFSEKQDRGDSKKVLINRAAMEYWGIEDIDEVKLASSSWGGEDESHQIIGVIEDFHYQNLSKKIQPLVISYWDYVEIDFIIKIQENTFAETLAALKVKFDEVNEGRTFSYTLLESELSKQYAHEKKLSDLFFLFTTTGLLISSLGLFTFALFETRKRIKEIGIRKVVGANTFQVMKLLSTSMVKWVIIAFAIACPISWYLSSEWLANFANQTPLEWWLFAGAGVMVVLFALITVVGQTYLAARRNPVEALRYE